MQDRHCPLNGNGAKGTRRTTGATTPWGAYRAGICGTCKVKKLSGEVHMVHNGGISEDDIAAGYILACCSHPIGRVALDV